MRNLGISVYPGHASLDENLRYIELAGKYGFTRIFTCLLSVKGDKEKIVSDFKNTIKFADSKGMKVIADVNPGVFKEFGISYNDLSFFKDLGSAGIRLDIGFTGNEEAMMTYNPQGLFIELNMSGGTKYIDNIMSYKPNLNKLIGCHNFYPHRYTGLKYDHFIKCTKQFKDLGIRTAAFVSSKDGTFGPWAVSEGLCTLEMHRDMNIVPQVKHMFATGLIDDVIIANAFASEEELKAVSEINRDKISLNVELADSIPDTERKIILEEMHFNRGDVSEYMIRSTQSRVKYKGHKFLPFNIKPIKRGDILMDNSLYEHYAGELQIALKDMENSGRTNVIGKVIPEEQFLLDYIEPWQKFEFTLADIC